MSCRQRTSTQQPVAFGLPLPGSFQTPAVAEKISALLGLVSTWAQALNLFFNISVVVATWLPFIVMILVPLLVVAEPLLVLDAGIFLLTSPWQLLGSSISQLASSLRSGQPTFGPELPFCHPLPTIANATSPSMPEHYMVVSQNPPSSFPPFAAGGGALLAFGLGGGVGVFQSQRVFGALGSLR